jgi:hypothetical protein
MTFTKPSKFGSQVWANSNFANDEKFQAQPLSTLPLVKASFPPFFATNCR